MASFLQCEILFQACLGVAYLTRRGCDRLAINCFGLVCRLQDARPASLWPEHSLLYNGDGLRAVEPLAIQLHPPKPSIH
jgi:hypothetical protein